MIQKIQLTGLRFFSHHGLYEEEQKKGGWFLVDIEFQCDATKAIKTDDISGTINYEQIYSIVREEMKIPSKLIEHVAGRINSRILEEIKGVSNLRIALKKLEAPLGGPLDHVSFTIIN